MEEKIIGPKTARKEFFSQHIDLERPEFAGLKEALAADDIAKCEKIFADAMRNNPLREIFIETRRKSLENASPEYIKEIDRKAHELMDYIFYSCGIRHQFTERKIDWTFNPTYNGYMEWPWGFNRHDIGPVASYYFLTGDEEAAKFYADYMQSWIQQAIAPPIGAPGHAVGPGVERVTWRTIEAGIRMKGWFGHFSTMIGSPNISDKLICDFYTSAYEHGVRLRNDYTTFNWLTMEMNGLINICCACPFIKYVDEWYDFAIRTLIEQLDVQLYADGFQAELSTNYHFVVDLNYVQIIELIERFGREIPDILLKSLEKAFDFYYKIMRPDGRIPDLNDGNEYDVAWRLGLITKYYPENEHYKYFATHGKEGKAPEHLSYPFEWSGAMVMRSGWERDDIWSYMDCSPFGVGHQHEDKLNLLLSAYGKNMLIEGGNYDYDNSDMRRYVISSRSHNTVMLNGKEQNRMKTYRREDMDINKKADLEYKCGDGYESACSHFDEGYGSDLENMTHERKLIFIKDAEKYGLKPFFMVVDRFTAEDSEPRKYEQMWHTEAIEYTQGADFAIGDFGDGVGLMFATSDKDAAFVNMKGQYEPYYQGWYKILPCGPHEHRPINTPVLVGSFEGKKRVVTVLYPYNEGENNLISIEASADFDALELTLNCKNGKFTLSEKDFM